MRIFCLLFENMSSLLLLLQLSICFAYENIALNKETFMQHTYVYSSGNATFDSKNAVDGRKSDLSAFGGECAISADLKRNATWWVNLGMIVSIHHIDIYHRTDNKAWDTSSSFPSRYLGFSLYVSNSTDRSEGILCFKDTHFDQNTIPVMFTTSCLMHGQYLIYYNERVDGVTYPDDYSTYAFSDLCEVEVYGCSTPGYYGSNCSTPCSDPNCRYCHLETGTCQGCKQGYVGHRCETGQDVTQTNILTVFLTVLFSVLCVVGLAAVVHFLLKRVRKCGEEGPRVQTDPEGQISTEEEEVVEVQTVSEEETFSREQHVPVEDGDGLCKEVFNELEARRKQSSNVGLALNAHANTQVHTCPDEEPSPDVQHVPGVEEGGLYEEMSNEVVASKEQASSVELPINAKAALEVQSGLVEESFPHVQDVPVVEDGLYEEMCYGVVASTEQTSSVGLALNAHAALQVHRGPEEQPSPDVQHAPGVEDSRLYEEISNEVVTCREQTSSVGLANNANTTLDVQSGPVEGSFPDVQHVPVVEDGLYEEMSNEVVASSEQASSVELALSTQAKQVPDVLPPAQQKAFNKGIQNLPCCKDNRQ